MFESHFGKMQLVLDGHDSRYMLPNRLLTRLAIARLREPCRDYGMAIARCGKCGKPTTNVKPPGYADRPFSPAGHPNSGIVCGKPGCEESGLIWLKKDEER